MTGALALAAGGVLLAAGSLRVAAQLAPRSTASFLLGAYVVAWAQLVAVLWALSLFGWVTRWALLAGLALVCVAILVDRRGWKDVVGAPPRRRLRAPARARRPAVRGARRRRPRRVRLRRRARPRDAAERLRHGLRPPLARCPLAREPGGRVPGLRLRAVRQRLPAARGDGRARDDGARRLRPLRGARPGGRVRRARGRRRRRGARAGPLAPRGAPRRPAGRDAARDRAAGVDGAERPRRRVFPRRRGRLPAGQGPRGALARRRRHGARDRDEGLGGLRPAGARRRRPARRSEPPRAAAGRRPRRRRRRRVLVRRELGGGRELGRGIPLRGRRPGRRRHGRPSASLGDPADRASRGRRPRPVALPRGRGDPLRGARGRLPPAERRHCRRLRGCGRARRRPAGPDARRPALRRPGIPRALARRRPGRPRGRRRAGHHALRLERHVVRAARRPARSSPGSFSP